jgi:hypothetical protein
MPFYYWIFVGFCGFIIFWAVLLTIVTYYILKKFDKNRRENKK